MVFYLAGQTSFGNRGCEALVRGTIDILRETQGPTTRFLVPSVDAAADIRQWPDHADYGVRFVTGQCGKNVPLDLNWNSLADPDTTLVVYMGLAKLPEISAELIRAGMPMEQPAMAISKGTLDCETVIAGTIATLPKQVKDVRLAPPVLIVIGRVVTLIETLGRDMVRQMQEIP